MTQPATQKLRVQIQQHQFSNFLVDDLTFNSEVVGSNYWFINFIFNFSASSFLPVSYESAKACAVVVDDSTSNSEVASSNTAASSLQQAASLDNVNNAVSVVSSSSAKDSSHKNLPPDGTTFKQISLGKMNIEFRVFKEDTFFTLVFYDLGWSQ